MGSATTLGEWSPGLGAALTTEVVRTRHHLATLPLFNDEGLIELLDRHPRSALQAYAPGAPGASAWPAVLLEGVDGATLLAAVREQSLWLNVLRVDLHHESLRDLQDHLFAEVGTVLTDFVPGSGSSTLLLSSPGATVPYHLDPGPNILWQVRGRKRVYVYPAANDEFVARRTREDLFAGVLREYVPYEPDFDTAARVEDLGPGDAIGWPLNSPHRVVGVEGLNVSLNTEFATKRSRRRSQLYCANRFLGRRLRLPVGSTVERGLSASTKIAAYHLARRLRLDRPRVPGSIDAEFVLDPTTHRLEPLDAPRPASFA